MSKGVSKNYGNLLNELKLEGYTSYAFANWYFKGVGWNYDLVKMSNYSKNVQLVVGYLKDGRLYKQESPMELVRDGIKFSYRSGRYRLDTLARLQFEGCPRFEELYNVVASPEQLSKSVNGVVKLPVPVYIHAKSDDEALNRLSKYLPSIIEVWNNRR